jgi:non-ribosomal peptide synthetase component F
MTASEYTILATSERHREFAAFWRGQFSDPEGFGTRRPQGAAADPSVTRGGGSRRRSMVVALGMGARAAIDTLATDDLGRFTVAAAGLSLALARYLNRDKILLRTPLLTGGDAAVLNETHEVPLVFGVDDETSLRDFLQQSAAIVEESYALQDYPVGACAQLDCGVDLDAIVEFSVSSARVHGPSATRHAAIHFTWDDGHPDRIEMSIDPDELEPWLADGLAEVVSATFEQFADLSTRIDDIDRLPSGQRQQLLADWNDTAVTWDPFVPSHRLFEDRARQSPGAVALRYESETVTFGELDARANRLAHHLMAAGGQARSSAIGIWMNRSPWLAVAVLGVLKAGRAYLPIDTACPPDRLRFMVGDARVTHLLVDEAHAEQTAELSCASILVDRELQASPAAPDVAVGSSDLAYVIYTSGSTGVPKGCAIQHGSMMNYLRWAMGYYWTSPDAGAMALFTPLSFDLTIPSFFCPLLRGRTLHIFPQDLAIDEVLRRQFSPGSGIDSIKLTPAHIRVLQALPIERSDVGLAIVGGEALTADMVRALHALNPAMRVVNE